MKYLVLVGNRNEQFFQFLKNTSTVIVSNIYKRLTFPRRIIRKCFSYFDKCPVFLFEKFANDDFKPDIIIISDDTVDSSLFKLLRKIYPHAKLIYWFRNSLDAVDYKKAKEIHLKHSRLCDYVISFDKNDSKKYGFCYIENCYYRPKSLENLKNNYDVVFLGTDKSRYELIDEFYQRCKKYNLRTWIYVYSYTRDESLLVHHKFVNYNCYLEYVRKSKAILDVVDRNYQNGYSLRVFEALFYRKKLITNDTGIVNEPFYNKNNIYVFAPSNWESLNGLYDFLNAPYYDIKDEIKNKYEFYHWLNRVENLCW